MRIAVWRPVSERSMSTTAPPRSIPPDGKQQPAAREVRACPGAFERDHVHARLEAFRSDSECGRILAAQRWELDLLEFGLMSLDHGEPGVGSVAAGERERVRPAFSAWLRARVP